MSDDFPLEEGFEDFEYEMDEEDGDSEESVSGVGGDSDSDSNASFGSNSGSGIDSGETVSESTGGESDREIPFVHLHLHSHYSLLDGAGKIDALIKRAKELNMPAMGLTDHGNLHGMLEYYQKALAENLKPILGFEAYIAPVSRFNKSGGAGKNSAFHLTLLAMNHQGYRHLILLSTQAFLEGYYYRPRIDKELLAAHSDGLICLSGCLGGEFSQAIFQGNGSPEALEKAKRIALWYKELFGDRYYIELQDNGMKAQKDVLDHAWRIAKELDIPTVATNDVHYVRQEDADAQDLLLCISTGKYRTDANRMRMETDQFYMRSGAEMLAAMPEHEDAVRRTVEIADRCQLDLELGKRFFPNFIPPDGLSSDDYLRKLCIEGLKRRYADNPKRLINGELSQEVMDRLNRELSVIKKLGFPNYFLIVWDFVRVAEERGIQRTARGSGVGALVCFALNLSHVCPLEFDLLFERFLDENRIEAPDIDIDFDQLRRGEILDYVKEKYGEKNVAQIGTFGTMAAKMAIKDVGRALGMSVSAVSDITKLVPDAPKMTLKKAFDESPEFKKVYDENTEVQELINYAKQVEGLARSTGTHACAVVISDRPLTDFVPLQRVAGKEEYVTQWAAAEVEKAGLLKMDFLGLRNLSILSSAIDIIEKTTGVRINPYKFPLNDKKTYDLLCRGETKGVFQLEGEGIRGLLTRMKPDNFRDIIATLALYRPGPLEGGMVDSYIEVKHGRAKAEYAHPVMKDILEETNGVMVYQEQIMRIFNRLGKIPLASSYTCIKAISKKKHDKIAKFKEDFIVGAQENGLTAKRAEELFELIEKFAGYGFNKSHSTAYALVAYMTAYLKAHYPAEFMAALLCGDVSNRNFTKKDSTVEHIEDCQRMGIEVLPPNVNLSEGAYRVIDGKITFGLTAIKGCGEDAVLAIQKAREKNGAFRSIFDFCNRVDPKACGRSTVESLIKAGAFDVLGVKRSQNMAVLEKAFKAGQTAALDRNKGQQSLFDLLDQKKKEEKNEDLAPLTEGFPGLDEWTDKEKAAFEKEVLGFYMTAHPLKPFLPRFRMFASHSIGQAVLLPDRTPVVLGGMISSIRIMSLKKPKPGRPSTFAGFDFEDADGTTAAIIWSENYAIYSSLIQPDAIVFAVGYIDRRRSEDDGVGSLVVERLLTVDDAEKELTSGAMIILQEQNNGENDIKTLHEILRTYLPDRHENPEMIRTGELRLQIRHKDGRKTFLKCPRFKIEINAEMRRRVTEKFGEGSFQLIPAPRPEAPPKKKWENYKKNKE